MFESLKESLQKPTENNLEHLYILEFLHGEKKFTYLIFRQNFMDMLKRKTHKKFIF